MHNVNNLTVQIKLKHAVHTIPVEVNIHQYVADLEKTPPTPVSKKQKYTTKENSVWLP